MGLEFLRWGWSWLGHLGSGECLGLLGREWLPGTPAVEPPTRWPESFRPGLAHAVEARAGLRATGALVEHGAQVVTEPHCLFDQGATQEFPGPGEGLLGARTQPPGRAVALERVRAGQQAKAQAAEGALRRRRKPPRPADPGGAVQQLAVVGRERLAIGLE